MIAVPSFTDTENMADWAELSCIFSNKDSLSKAELLRALEDAQVKDAEAVLASIWLETERRSRLLPSKYPFDTEKSRLTIRNRSEVPLEYLFPLLLSRHHWYKSTKIKKADWNRVSKLFEEYSTLAIRNYFQGKALTIGWPRNADLPQNFRQSINLVCESIKENQGTCSLMSRRPKDEGVDIIAWIPFPDNRPSKAIMLVQCAAGQDYEEKASEPHIATWNSFIDWRVRPIPALTFPFICTDELKWARLSSINESILFDRLRLAALCSFSEEDSATKKRILDWVKHQANSLPKSEI